MARRTSVGTGVTVTVLVCQGLDSEAFQTRLFFKSAPRAWRRNLNLDVLLVAFFKVWLSTTVLGAGANVL